jgi:hypothetical protein
MSSRATRKIDFAVRCGIGALLVLGAVTKIAAPSRFLTALFAYELPLPSLALRAAAVWIPWVEMFLGVLLIANVWAESARPAVLVLCSTFLLVTFQAWLRGLDISCHCADVESFGFDPGRWGRFLESPGVATERNILLLIGCILLNRSGAVLGGKEPPRQETRGESCLSP